MLLLLSPAKSLNLDPPTVRLALTQPVLKDDIAVLDGYTRKLTARKLKSLMGISDALATLNHERFQAFDPSVEEAAWSLGVSPARTFRKITFPLIFPGVLSAMLFAFTLSYDEFSRTLFASGRDLTLPLAIYGTFSVEVHPNVFAFGVLTTLFSFALLSVYAILMSLSVRRARRVAVQEEA